MPLHLPFHRPPAAVRPSPAAAPARGFGPASHLRAPAASGGYDFIRVRIRAVEEDVGDSGAASGAPIQRVLMHGRYNKPMKEVGYYDKYLQTHGPAIRALEARKAVVRVRNEKHFEQLLLENAPVGDKRKRAHLRGSDSEAEKQPRKKTKREARVSDSSDSEPEEQPRRQAKRSEKREASDGGSESEKRPRKKAKRPVKRAPARALKNELGLAPPGTDPQTRTFSRRLSFTMDDSDGEFTVRGQDFHEQLHRMGSGNKGNQIHAGMSIHWDDSDEEDGVQSAFAPFNRTWHSGDRGKAAKINDLMDTLGTTGARTSEKIEHSEQDMGVDVAEKPSILQEPLPRLMARMPERAKVRAIGYEAHSHPNSVCNPCQTTLDSVARNKAWQDEMKKKLREEGHDVSKAKFVLRNSSDDQFSGAGKSMEKAQKLTDDVPTYAPDRVPSIINQLPDVLLGKRKRK